jgi:Holliday junction resolvase|nr:MAG TPA: HOLLIDAY JUNCTION RESOLVASE HOMOLOGOUS RECOMBINATION [Caudoviricetes sp.]
MNSKRKGKEGELRLVHFLREHGYECRRTAQYCGKTGEAADVIGLPGLHIECKAVERLNVREALKQAVRDAAAALIPVVFHRHSREEWLVTLRAEDFMTIYREWEAGRHDDQ